MKQIDLKLNLEEIVERIETLMPRKKSGELACGTWADKIGVSPQIVSNVHSKTHEKRILPSTNYILAAALANPDIDIRWLLTGEGQDPQLSDDASLARLISILELIAGALRHDRRARSITALEGIVASWARALISSGLDREEVKRLLQKTTRVEEEKVGSLKKTTDDRKGY